MPVDIGQVFHRILILQVDKMDDGMKSRLQPNSSSMKSNKGKCTTKTITLVQPVSKTKKNLIFTFLPSL